jgi:hypothetical protein
MVSLGLQTRLAAGVEMPGGGSGVAVHAIGSVVIHLLTEGQGSSIPESMLAQGKSLVKKGSLR